MMWNLLVSGLLTGSTVVLYDGNPGHPDLGTLWRVAEKHGVAYFGVSAPYVHACLKAGLRPVDQFDLSTVRALGSTGAPLSPEGFRWVADAVGKHVQVCSVSGGTDLCTAFLEAAPTVPVWMGELSCAALGASVAAYAIPRRGGCRRGRRVGADEADAVDAGFLLERPGRLAAAGRLLRPLPRSLAAWRLGAPDPRGSYVIYGRSDSTLNRGGVRMGTADFYAVVEGHEQVIDSLVIDTTELGAASDGELLCFLVLAPGARLAEVERNCDRRCAPSSRHATCPTGSSWSGDTTHPQRQKVRGAGEAHPRGCRPGPGGEPGCVAEPGIAGHLHRDGSSELSSRRARRGSSGGVGPPAPSAIASMTSRSASARNVSAANPAQREYGCCPASAAKETS